MAAATWATASPYRGGPGLFIGDHLYRILGPVLHFTSGHYHVLRCPDAVSDAEPVSARIRGTVL